MPMTFVAAEPPESLGLAAYDLTRADTGRQACRCRTIGATALATKSPYPARRCHQSASAATNGPIGGLVSGLALAWVHLAKPMLGTDSHPTWVDPTL